MSVLIWVQTVCNGHQQKRKVAGRKEKVKYHIHSKYSVIHTWTRPIRQIYIPDEGLFERNM